MTHRQTSRRLLGLATATLTLAGALGATLTAASADTPRSVRKACGPDAQRLCPREKPNSPEMEYCMEAKGKQLSRRCVRALEDEGMIPRGYFKS